jgi:hypothetical protein
MRTEDVKQSGNGTKENDFRHKIAQSLLMVSQDAHGEDRKKFGFRLEMTELAFSGNLSKASLSI